MINDFLVRNEIDYRTKICNFNAIAIVNELAKIFVN